MSFCAHVLCKLRADEVENLARSDKKNNSSVHGSQGKLMLCDECEHVRFPYTKQCRLASSGSTDNQVNIRLQCHCHGW